MSKADTTNTTPGADPPAAEPMGKWGIGDVEPVLHKLKAEIAIFGHLLNTRDEVSPDTFAKIEDDLIDSHA